MSYEEELVMSEDELLKLLKVKGADTIANHLEENQKFLQEMVTKFRNKELTYSEYDKLILEWFTKREHNIHPDCKEIGMMFGKAVDILKIAVSKYRLGMKLENEAIIEDAIMETYSSNMIEPMASGELKIKDIKNPILQERLRSLTDVDTAQLKTVKYIRDIGALMDNRESPRLVANALQAILTDISNRALRLVVDCQCAQGDPCKLTKEELRAFKRKELKKKIEEIKK